MWREELLEAIRGRRDNAERSAQIWREELLEAIRGRRDDVERSAQIWREEILEAMRGRSLTGEQIHFSEHCELNVER
jgi:hypothetical protein